MPFGNKASQLENLKTCFELMELAVQNSQEFEPDIHPNSLSKYQFHQRAFIDHIGNVTLDSLDIPEEDGELRLFYLDCMYEHFFRRTITKEHLEELLISWKKNDIIKQAE